MFTDRMMNDAVKKFLQNPSYRDEYENAPSDACKKRIAFIYCNSVNNWREYFASLEEFNAQRDSIEAELGLDDWKHMLKYAGNNQWRGICRQKVRELEAQKG